MVFKHQINWWNLKLDNDTREHLLQAFDDKYLSNGPISIKLQSDLKNFLNNPYVTLTTSGSVALLIALKVLGIKENDEVIIPNRTFQATANAVYFLGANVRCAEVDESRGLICADSIKSIISSKTKAIIVVHLNGRAVDMDPIISLAKENNLYVIEDVAQAFGSEYKGKKLGTIGDVGCFSFGVTKFLTLGQGGAITCKDAEINSRIHNYLFHSQTGDDDKRFDLPGFNFRISNLLASLGVSQISKVKEMKNKYIEIFEYYKKELAGINQIKFISTYLDREVPIWAEVLCEDRDGLFIHLKDRGIESVKFYPSISDAKYFKIEDQGGFEISNLFFRNGLILPCGLSISLDELAIVTNEIKLFYKEK